MLGFNESNAVRTFRPMSSSAGDSPVVDCGVVRYENSHLCSLSNSVSPFILLIPCLKTPQLFRPFHCWKDGKGHW